ncbi:MULTISPECIES: putative zinc-binding peptidase [Rhodomicrobium]|uniref:zinc-binding metallopeptidase family protein n=1 Tax=Rhodomicrobium TaxID=1068 RepID=UPI000B4AB7CA|nr:MULTISPECIES: putative zinc-binding peptidase [Rhodomicrobium]
MRVFSCGKCGQPVYFDNVVCQNCGTALGFDPISLTMLTLFPDEDGGFATHPSRKNRMVYCANFGQQVCNWLVPAERRGDYCLSCGLNRTIPDLTVPGNLERWFEFEKAKRRLIYELLKLRLPVKSAGEVNGVPPLVFDILADAKTGHENGVITLNVAEADPAVRESTRAQFGEPYRTLLGHFRHESGHYYWMALVDNSRWLERFRALFGDERADYGEALAAYHQNGPKADWGENYISAYATAHPWEDWAESWAHYLHMVEALDTADDYRLVPRLPNQKTGSWWTPASGSADPYQAASARKLIDRWVPLALAVNSLNRSMGLTDFYPFVVSPAAAEKLDLVHQIVKSARRN